MKEIRIDRTKALHEEPSKGHNRFHPDIPPVIEVDEGEETFFQTRAACDNQLNKHSTLETFLRNDPRRPHPLTGPAYVKGAEPGDLLEIEILDVIPGDWAFTGIRKGRGYLRDYYEEPFLAIWSLKDGWATSAQVPGVRVPGAPFPGVVAVAPSSKQVAAWAKREAELAAQGGVAALPDPVSAIPNVEPIASEGLRTMPPRENGGNMDVKQLTKGARLFLPVNVPGALVSIGDAHFAQGDGEVCLQAVEMDSDTSVRFTLHKGEAARKGIVWPRMARTTHFTDPRYGMPQRFIATMGMPIRPDGSNAGEDLNWACKNALLQMIDLLCERGFSRHQAYVICSVAVDLKISQIVDAPNFIVSAVLPEEVIEG